MSNGNQNIIQVIFNKIFGSGKSSALTSKKNEIILKLVKMHILEMEDVLFHLNSAVMMPENPQGKSSAQGGGASDEQLVLTGLKALALVYKQFEFDPDSKIVISGHTDTSGTFDLNFKLSDERAKNILYLLIGTKEEWAKICYGRQKIEDYQQIMKHFEKKIVCGCDPDKVDDTWGDKTKTATLNFFKKTVPGKAVSLFAQVENDSKKRWPLEAWYPVYDLYSQEIVEVLEISLAELESRRKSSVKFIDDKKPFVGCGESFPIDAKEKNNYRSQKNRRVEILFFDKDEIPELNCPAVINRAHTEDECPLWKKFYFIPLYIDPEDLKAVVFHLQFVYYDRVKQKQLPVPDGLKIQAFENGHKQIPTESIYKKGVYFVKVKFNKKIKNPARTEFYFEIEAIDRYIFTKDKDSEPVVIIKKSAEVNALGFLDKIKYYDLPEFWSSKNYWTRFNGDFNKGERFEKVFNDTSFTDSLKLKPFGDEITKPDKPLLFSLDDIVLADTTRSQIVQDKNQNGSVMALDDNSRYALFHVDYETKETVGKENKNLRRIKIYKPEAAQPVFTDVKFNTNLISDVPINTRVVYFCNDFYDVGIQRSKAVDTSFDYTKNHIAGARLALKNDPLIQKSKDVIATNALDRSNAYALTGCGNYEMHYFHDCAELDGKPLNYLIIYWNCRFIFNQGGTAADVTNHRQQGMLNAMDRMNKNYLVEKHSGTEDMFIRLFFYMEAKNDTNGGSQKCSVSVTDNTNGAWMRTGDAKFRSRDYQSDPTYFGTPDPINSLKDVDGNTYTVLTNHHEMGHATGNWDSYLYNYSSGGNTWTGLPQYDQPFTAIGGPYRFDELARMYHNRSPRIRNYWKYVLWLNDESDVGKALHSFLKGSKYKITHQGLKHKHEFFLASQYKNVELAARSQLDHNVAANHNVDLFLYKLGDDEFSIMAKTGQVINGILVIKIRLAFRFIDTGNGSWDFANQLDWAQRFNNDVGAMLNRKFRIATNTNNDFKNLFVVFTPSYQVYSGVAPADSQYNIEVSFQLGNNFNSNGKRIQVDWDINKKRIIRYLFGKTTGTSDLTKTDFESIVNWVESPGVGNASYTMHNL